MNSDSISHLPPVSAGQRLSSPLGVVLSPDESHQRDQKRQDKRRRQGEQNLQGRIKAVEEPIDLSAQESAEEPPPKSDDSDEHTIDYYT